MTFPAWTILNERGMCLRPGGRDALLHRDAVELGVNLGAKVIPSRQVVNEQALPRIQAAHEWYTKVIFALGS